VLVLVFSLMEETEMKEVGLEAVESLGWPSVPVLCIMGACTGLFVST
jgi:hypothetical protein